ncbi:unnamed protein product [Pararhodospirillum photometricum DSM 122]|uniref:Uncharacterized protein n=1 Tax=Pararhodospirillum photometricum DSM 122 TaxID=1150469 RepID=H6SKA9_PARPM|nr:unnamed protein product [Pararhodospirillum photometricum DSM 122]
MPGLGGGGAGTPQTLGARRGLRPNGSGSPPRLSEGPAGSGGALAGPGQGAPGLSGGRGSPLQALSARRGLRPYRRHGRGSSLTRHPSPLSGRRPNAPRLARRPQGAQEARGVSG